MRLRSIANALLLFWIIGTFSNIGVAEAKPSMNKEPFGKTEDGRAVDIYTLTSKKGMEVRITNFGGIVVSLKAPDRNGKFEDVVLGYDSIEGYLTNKAFFGALIGRYGNRIGHGQFKLDGKTYDLPKNDGDNTLHGGKVGFNKRLWTAKDVSGAKGQALQLTYTSKDGEEGFPGTLTATGTGNVLWHGETSTIRLRPIKIPWSISPITPTSIWLDRETATFLAIS